MILKILKSEMSSRKKFLAETFLMPNENYYCLTLGLHCIFDITTISFLGCPSTRCCSPTNASQSK